MSHFRDSDVELVEFFTSSIGLAAQGYESNGGVFDPGRVDEKLALQFQRGVMARYDATMSTLAKLVAHHRRILDLVYTPFGTGFSPSAKAAAKNKKAADEAPDFLAIALTPASYGGSYLRLALYQDRVLTAYGKAFPNDAANQDPARLIRFLSFEAGRGDERKSFFARVRDDCSIPHGKALAAYDELRTERREREAIEGRARARLREAEREALLESMLEAKSRKSRERFEWLLRGANGANRD